MAKAKSLLSESQKSQDPAASAALVPVGGALARCGSTPLPDVKTNDGGTYLGFAPIKGERAADFRSKGLNAADPYIHHEDGSIEPLRPLRFHLVTGSVFYVRTTDKYEETHVRLDEPEEAERKRDKWFALVETVMLIYTPSGIVAARGGWRSVVADGARDAIAAVKNAAEPGWALEPGNAGAARMSPPYLRVIHTAKTGARPGKGSGNVYAWSRCRAEPTTPADVAMLEAFFASKGNVASADAAVQAFDQRVSHLMEMTKK